MQGIEISPDDQVEDVKNGIKTDGIFINFHHGKTISTQIQEEDLKLKKSLRPQTLSEYIDRKSKENLEVYIEATKNRRES